MDKILYQRTFSPDDILLSLKEVREITKYSKAGIYKLMKQDRFPRPISASARRRYWLKREIIAYLDECLKQRNQKYNVGEING